MSTRLSKRETWKSIVLDLAQHSTLLLGLVYSPPSEWWIVLFALIDWHGFKRTFDCRNAVMVWSALLAWPVRETRRNHEGSSQLSGFEARFPSVCMSSSTNKSASPWNATPSVKSRSMKVMTFYFQLTGHLRNYSNSSVYRESDSLVNTRLENSFGIRVTFEQFLPWMHPPQPPLTLLRVKPSYDRNKTLRRA